MTDKIKSLCEDAAKVFGCEPEDFRGCAIGTLLKDCERQGGVVVYWGCWTAEELNQVI